MSHGRDSRFKNKNKKQKHNKTKQKHHCGLQPFVVILVSSSLDRLLVVVFFCLFVFFFFWSHGFIVDMVETQLMNIQLKLLEIKTDHFFVYQSGLTKSLNCHWMPALIWGFTAWRGSRVTIASLKDFRTC